VENNEREPPAPFKPYPGFREFALKNYSTEALKRRRNQSINEHSAEPIDRADIEESQL